MNKPGRNGPHIRHADVVRATVELSSCATQSAVAASWRRSLLYHQLNPEASSPPERIEEAGLREARERLGILVGAAGPVIDRMLETLGQSGFCVLLTDTDGVIVDRRGLPSDDDIFSGWGLWTGAIWSEAKEGTNGIGTCLAEQRPVAILRNHHFRARNTEMSCMSSPVFDHTGRLAAVLDVSCCRDDVIASLAPLVSALIADAAHRIECAAFRAAFPNCRILMIPSQSQYPSALLAVDRYDLVVGATRMARQALGLTTDWLERPASDLIGDGSQASSLRIAEQAELRRALARTKGNVSAAARELGIGRATLYRRMRRAGLSEYSEIPDIPLGIAPAHGEGPFCLRTETHPASHTQRDW